MRPLINSILIMMLLISLLGCSNARNAILPEEQQNISSESLTQNQKSMSYPGVLGAWKVLLDAENLTAEIYPARNAAKIGDTFDADLSQFLTISPCENCLAIAGIRRAEDNNIHLDILMRHPFTNIATRPDLHGFDVRAIFLIASPYYMSIPMKITKPDGTEEDAKIANGWILNAEGFTSHYDELIDDPNYFLYTEDAPANLNPYLRFFETWSMGTFDPQNPTGYNVMPVGTKTYQRTAVISGYNLDKMWLYIVADVAYGQSAVLANRTNPQYYLPAFNRTEPWRMEYWIESNNLTYNDPDSTAELVVQVFDWQHNAAVDPSYPNPSNLSGLKESSKVASLEAYFPSMMTNPVVATIPESGNGTPSSPLQYRMIVRNELQYPASEIEGYIAIRDQLYGAASPSGRSPIPESPSGFPYATSDIRDYAYYGMIRINVPNLSYPQKYNGELWVDSTTLFDRWGTNVNAGFFMDYSHKMFQYRWDFDYDGVNFDMDGSGLPSSYIDLSTPGKRNLALRVRTNSVPPGEYIYEMAAYGPGLADEERIEDTGPYSSTSRSNSNAVALVDDTFYIAYQSTLSGSYGIHLARYKEGELLSDTTVVPGSDYVDPAMVIIPTGANAGVYMAYIEEVGMPEIYTIHGNLDGTGFEPANIGHLSVGQGVYSPCLIYHNDILYCIFQETNAPTYSRITSMRSTDFGHTWTDKVFVEGAALYQYNPSITIKGNRFHCVWEDKRDEGTLGTDLYLGFTDDCLSWSSNGNILDTPDNIDEYAPSIAAGGEKIAVAYLSQRNGASDVDLRIHIIGYSGSLDMALENASGNDMCTNPAIDVVNTMSYQNFYLVSYGFYNSGTQLLQSRTRCYTDRNGWDLLEDIFRIDEEVGSGIASDAAQTYPGVAAQSVIDGNAIEHYIVRRTFEDGIEGGFGDYYGKMDVLWYISDGNDQY